MRGGLALTLSDQPYETTVGIDTQNLSDSAREEVDRISRLESAGSLDDFVTFAQEVRRYTHLVLPIVGPSAPHRCTQTQLLRCLAVAIELDTMIHMHVCETKGQFLQGKQLFGTTPVTYLDKIGVLTDRMSMAHCVWLTDDDIERVAARGTIVVHNPASNGKLGSGRMRFDICSGVACAGIQPTVLAATIRKTCLRRCGSRVFGTIVATAITATGQRREDVLRAATSGSAHALGLGSKAGMIEAGRLADLVMLTTDSYHFAPLNDVINQLVYCENGISVTDVMIDGRWVLRQGKLLTIDEARLYARGRALRAEMAGRLNEQFRRTAEIEPALREQYLKAAGTPWSDRDGAS